MWRGCCKKVDSYQETLDSSVSKKKRVFLQGICNCEGDLGAPDRSGY